MNTRLEMLVQPGSGVIGRVRRLQVRPGEYDFSIMTGHVGDVSQAVPGLARAAAMGHRAGSLDGAGGGLDDDTARVRAIAESLERYASSVYDDRQFLWATAAELGDAALNLDTVPRCSPAELAHPRCHVVLPNKEMPLRWVRGISLISGRPIWIPAIMVYLNLPALSPSERFWLPISTGCAAHPDLAQALVNGICEVVERDAVSLVWLQQLALPRLVLDLDSSVLEAHLAQTRGKRVQTVLFDATTDLGIPTVYGVDLSLHNPKLAINVACVTDVDPVSAVSKLFRESVAGRMALQSNGEPPADPDEFIEVWHGGVYMGQRARMGAFDFLLNARQERRLSAFPKMSDGSSIDLLKGLLKLFAARQMEVAAVDLSTDEATRAGMRVIRVVIPELMPLTFTPRARYLAHPRLYRAPALMGYPVRPEQQLNPFPQPFA